MTEEIKYDCWSSNGENYHSDIDSVINESNIGDTIYEGVMQKPVVKYWISAEHIIEGIQDSCWDEYGEWADDFLKNISSDAKNELRILISDWVIKHDNPRFWLATQVREREVTAEDIG